MNPRTNLKKKQKKAKVIRLEKTREIQYSRFVSRITIFSGIFLVFSSIVGGIVYFLIGQAKINVLNEKLLQDSSELRVRTKSKKVTENPPENYCFETNDKAEVSQ